MEIRYGGGVTITDSVLRQMAHRQSGAVTGSDVALIASSAPQSGRRFDAYAVRPTARLAVG
jgi:hypothetical protein